MKKEWFEPGPDGESPFEREYYNHRESGTMAGNAISAAFRALLAGEQSVDTQRSIAAALANGQLSLQDEITRLRAELARLKNECSDQQSYVLDLESAIARKDTRIKVLEVANDSLTQYSSNLAAERDALQSDRETHNQRLVEIYDRARNAEIERDALRARIDAGEVVYDGPSGWWCTEGPYSKIKALIIDRELIDARPIEQPDHIADPGKMVDERTAGTIADRGKACTPD